jgi:hypothetical protein
MVDDALGAGTRPQRLFQCVQDQFRVHRSGDSPADDPAREHVDHEGDVDEAGPVGDIGKAGHPQLVWSLGQELSVDAIQWPLGTAIAECRPALPAAPQVPRNGRGA